MHSFLPDLVVSDEQGNIFEIPEYSMVGMSLSDIIIPEKDDLIPLPDGSDLFRLPGRYPIGISKLTGEIEIVREIAGIKLNAVGAFMSPAYLQILRCAYKTSKGASRLPLYSYTAIGWQKDKYVVAGMRIDTDKRQDYCNFDICEINQKAKQIPKKYPGNRLIKHLMDNCVLRYGCPAARNFVMGRWECPIPTSIACNAACLGCISKQPCGTGFKASHERMTFTPTAKEIAEYVVPHLQNAPRPVASFGQGCEGEPLVNGELLIDAVREIRKLTSRGIINLNTNASRPDIIKELCEVGLDSMRVSISSTREEFYNAYYRPKNYSFTDVVDSLCIARNYGLWTSVNYLMFPGFTDTEEEIDSLSAFIDKTKIDMIQTRNLNIDPEYYIKTAKLNNTLKMYGIRNWVAYMKSEFPNIKLGYFNPPLSEMKKYKAK